VATFQEVRTYLPVSALGKLLEVIQTILISTQVAFTVLAMGRKFRRWKPGSPTSLHFCKCSASGERFSGLRPTSPQSALLLPYTPLSRIFDRAVRVINMLPVTISCKSLRCLRDWGVSGMHSRWLSSWTFGQNRTISRCFACHQRSGATLERNYEIFRTWLSPASAN
jgi:hypothetical protein